MPFPKPLVRRGWSFALAYAAMQLSRSLFALYAFKGTDASSFMTFARITMWLLVSSAFWVAGGLVSPESRAAFWIAALAIEYSAPLVRYWTPGIGARLPKHLM